MQDAATQDTDADAAEPVPQTLPLDAWHRARGGRMVPFAGYQMAVQYDGIIAEHLWTRSSASLFDVSHMGQLLLSGEGVDAALEALIPADLSTLQLGQLRYSLLLDGKAGILDDLIVARWPGGLYLVVNGAAKWDDIAWLREHLPDEIGINHMEERALLALQGPQAFAALARHVTGDYPLDALVFMTGGKFTIAGVEAWISRSGYTGEDGLEISIPAQAAETVADLLCAEPDVKPAGLGARDSLRLEAGLPLYGHDLDETTTPIEADLGFAISKRRREQGGFPGHARLMIEREQGPVRTRVGLLLDGRQPVREGALVLDGDGSEVGRVTSGGFSPSLERPIAMAYVPATCAAPGSAVRVEQRGRIFTGAVAPLPFVPHKYVRKAPSAKGSAA